MPLYLLTRVTPDSARSSPPWHRDWLVTDELVGVDSKATHAAVSARSVEHAAGLVTPPESPVVLRTGGPWASDGDQPQELAWMPKSRERFAVAVAELKSRPGEFWFWPSTNGVLSDVPSTGSFFRANQGGPFRLFLDPASLLTPEMLPKAEDHLERIFSALAGSASAILLANVEPLGGVEGVQLSPLTRGVLSPRVMVDLWREHADPGTPVVLLDEDVPGQRAMLGV